MPLYGQNGYGSGKYGIADNGPIYKLPLQYYLNLFTSEYQNSAKWLTWVRKSWQPFDDMSDMLSIMSGQFNVQTAVGKQLNTIGALIGASRQLPFQPTPITNTFLSTTFNEGSAGSTIVGTKPATYTGPSTGWSIPDSNVTATFVSGGGTAINNAGSNPTGGPIIDVGVSDYTLTVNLSSESGFVYNMVMLRYQDENNLVFCNFFNNTLALYTYIGGAAAALGSVSFAFNNQNIVFTLNGPSIVISSGGTTLLTANTSAFETNTVIGFSPESTSQSPSFTINSLNVKQTTIVSPVLDDATYRQLLLATIGINHWSGKLVDIYPIWKNVFPEGKLVINDNQNMTCTVIISGSFSGIVLDMIRNGLIIPRPEGVLYGYETTTLPIFGADLNTAYVAGADLGHAA